MIEDVMSLLKNKNSHPRDKLIKFFKEGHKYYGEGVLMDMSVTKWVPNFLLKFDSEFRVKQIVGCKKWSTDQNYKYYKLRNFTVFCQIQWSGKHLLQSWLPKHRRWLQTSPLTVGRLQFHGCCHYE